jgi:glutamate-1-semialdehyde 2,1-aminomutase
MPGGVNSPVRAFRGVGGTPFFVDRAEGARLWDVDGRSYVDFLGSWGPLILGHAAGPVVEAVTEAVRRGTSYGAPTAGEVEMAELIGRAVPSMEMVRLVSSGTEASMSAIRLARGVTGRDAIVKFDGCYHGHADSLLVKAGSGGATFGVPDSLGVPKALAALTLTVPFNDLEAVRRQLEAHPGEVAAIIVEPVAGNMGVVPPATGFLSGLRELATRHGSLLIFDEVITGFRVAWGGAQARYGVRPDLTCLGKIIGGGLPAAAFGGRADIMQKLAPLGPVYQAGTLSGNPLATAAGVSVLRRLRDPGVYDELERCSARLSDGLAPFGRVQRVGAMLTLFAGRDEPVERFSELDTDGYARLFRGLYERGVYVAPSQYECLFPSLAHTDEIVDQTIDAVRDHYAER